VVAIASVFRRDGSVSLVVDFMELVCSDVECESSSERHVDAVAHESKAGGNPSSVMEV
jgi:hypothetical protein